ncbi:MAG: hypothetical protein E4H13_14080 [Calditrichales bacterium]|nr:MAG: hypothetical protein E4H13_14080 [Calditrichales bacterium]
MVPQYPSPMQESVRAHQRVPQDSVQRQTIEIDAGLSRNVILYISQLAEDADSLRLLIHFHGAAYVPIYAVERDGRPWVVLSVHLGGGSSVYERPFTDEAVFPELMQLVTGKVSDSTHRPCVFSHGYLSGFSAGYGAIRALLQQPATVRAVDGIILMDGLHTDYIPDRLPLAEGGAVNAEKLNPFLTYARMAVEGHKNFLFTHSEIFPGTYASTTECADFLLKSLNVSPRAVLKWGPLGMQQISEANHDKFTILGFAGNTAPDHIDHYHALFHFLSRLD